MSKDSPPLIEGVINRYIGSSDGFEFYDVVATVYSYSGTQSAMLPGRAKIRDLGECEEFFLNLTGSREMVDYTCQLQWS